MTSISTRYALDQMPTTDIEKSSRKLKPVHRKLTWARIAGIMTKHAVLIVLCIIFLMPLFWMATGSFKTISDIGAFPVNWFPTTITTGNYTYGFSAFPFLRYFLNTLLICFPCMIGAALAIVDRAAFSPAKDGESAE